MPGVYLLRADTEGSKGVVGPAPAGADSLRLDRRTNCGGKSQSSVPSSVLCVRNYAKEAGIVQVGWARVGRKGKVGIRGKGKDPEENKRKGLGRARANLKRDLFEIAADRMLTLTYRENITDREKALKDLQEFERRVRRCYPNWKSAGTWEKQQRGALHCHLGISGFYDVKVLRRLWRRTVGEGNIDIAFKPDGKGNAQTKLACYMSKYIGKDMDQREFGEHRYHRSRDIDRRCERYYVEANKDHREVMLAYSVGRSLLEGETRMWAANIPKSNGLYGYMEVERSHFQPPEEEGLRMG